MLMGLQASYDNRVGDALETRSTTAIFGAAASTPPPAWRRGRRRPGGRRSEAAPCRLEPALLADEGDHRLDPVPRLHVAHHERPGLSHTRSVARHHLERGADIRGEIGLVDDQQVRARDPGTAFARDFFAA